MGNGKTKLKRVLGFAPTYGAAVGLVISGTGMFSVANIAGTTGYATFISVFIALIPMMVAAFAFGELAAMLPGGGMISDYTLPALGKFWATFALLSGYLVLVTTDGGTQFVMGGLSIEEMTGIPQIIATLILFLILVAINIINVNFYGRIEATFTIVMVLVFLGFSLLGNAGIGEMLQGSAPVNANIPFLPDGGWGTIFGAVGTGIWFFLGFEFACPMAEENKKPYKNIPIALILGLLTVYAIDSLFATAAVKYTDMQELKTSAIPQIVAAKAIMGKTGHIVVSLLTIFASFTTANAYLASLPRMLYGLSREGLVPAFFGKISQRFRTPIHGILFTACMMLGTIIFTSINGVEVEIMQAMINTACITWMFSYEIAIVDVLVLRRKYPDYPRLWKAPFAKVTMPLGLIGIAFGIYTLRDYLVYSLICMAVIALYCVIWFRHKGISLTKVPDIADMVADIRDRSEYLAVWDEAVDEWCKKHVS